ncbi:MAG TPA: GDSL-type esterase/lipase family protein [Gemmatales bacterium]|nr:GDSL-type esterase/lipase family protein [Gemmatales bacterium]
MYRFLLSLAALVGLAVGVVQTEPPEAKPAAPARTNQTDPPLKPQPPEPVPSQELEAAIRRGVDFLVRSQNEDGSFGNHYRTKNLNIYAPVPGSLWAFQCATTALGIAALIEVDDQRPEVLRALDRAESWMIDMLPKVRRATPDAIYNVWSHSYSIRALVRMHGRLPKDAERQAKIKKLIEQQIDFLSRYELVDGGWGYYDLKIGTQRPAGESSSFTAATALIALHEAAQLGLKLPDGMVKRATASIVRQRKPDFSYLYGEYLKWRPMMDINRPGGSLGRSQACNLALRIWGDQLITDEVLITWLDRLITRNLWLDIARKRPIPHESYFGVAGYFFYYGHFYAAQCIEALPPGQRPFYQDHLARILIPLQEQDGSWWDYPLYNYHQPYGTAYALMSLHRCRKEPPAAAPDTKAPPAGEGGARPATKDGVRPVVYVPLRSDDVPVPARSARATVIRHSHNDYFRARPLHDALAAGFDSVEADVHLVDGALLIGHDTWQLKPERTLESLYLKPLQELAAAHPQGRIQPRTGHFYLLIDVKTEAEATYQALDAVLRRYPELFSEYRDGQFIPRAVTAIISGNMARQSLLNQSHRFAGFDGREGEVWSDIPVHAMPWVSESWSKLFKWRGNSPMPDAEREKLAQFVGRAHTKGRLVRFWGVPERPDVWQELLDHQVDILGTDVPSRLTRFLEQPESAEQPAGHAPARFRPLRDGERVVLVGNNFLDRDRHHGWFETTLRQAFPKTRFIVRNLAWPGDTVDVQLRPLNYQPLEAQMEQIRPTLIFICFGTSEAHGGREKLPAFEKSLNRFLERLAPTKADLVLIAPPRHENLGPPWPDGREQNERLADYVAVTRRVAEQRAAGFVDLFDGLDGSCGAPLTDNGIHFNSAGYRRAWETAWGQLGWSPNSWADGVADQVRANVMAKERLWFDRYRAHNGEYIYGRRAKPGGGNSGNPSFEPEFAEFERLLTEADERIRLSAQPR